jgi:CMP-N-acetylneuraminic acid synthetase
MEGAMTIDTRLPQEIAYANGRTVLSDPAVARARALADALDAAMAERVILSTDGEIDILTMGLAYVVDKLRADPQAVVDDNLGWLLLVLDALAYVTDGTMTDRLTEYAPSLTT